MIWGSFIGDVYYDIVNLDQYDAVLGTPFMRKYGVCLDFSESVVRIGQHTIPTLLPREEEDAVKQRPRNFPLRRRETAPTTVAHPSVPPPSH